MSRWPTPLPPAPQLSLLAREVALPHTPRLLRVRARLFLTILGAFVALASPLALLASSAVQNGIERTYAERALHESQLIAGLPGVIAALNGQSPPDFNAGIEHYRQVLGADYIVITDRSARRLTHPNAARVGQRMIGGDFTSFLQGRSVTETVQGTLGPSVRAKVPVLRGEAVVGLASVGFLLPHLHDLFWQVVGAGLPWYLAALGLALGTANLLSRQVQGELLNLEPEQIASGLLHYRAVLNALEEGVLVVREGLIYVLNPQARTLLEPLLSAAPGQGVHNLPVLLPEVLRGLSDVPTPLDLAGRPVLAQARAAEDGTQVITLRDLAALRALADELTQSQHYAELLRSQTHEFTNRLHTLAGLLHLGEKEEALRLIHAQVSRHAAHLEAASRLRHVRLSALLLGKYDRAAELGVTLRLDPHSQLPAEVAAATLDLLELALGNLIENACEAASRQPGAAVQVLLGYDPEGLILEVRDNGPGLAPELAGRLTQRGVSSKGPRRGIGLELVQARAHALGGTLTFDRVTDASCVAWTRVTLDLPAEEPST